MTSAEKLGYLANLNRVRAQDTIHRHDFDAADYRAVYSLYLTAYGNKRVADEARRRALELYVDQCCNRNRR